MHLQNLSVNDTHSCPMRNTSQMSCVRRDGCEPQPDRVDRTRLVESCGSRDDSLIWNLSWVKQDDTIRVDGMGPEGRGQVEKESKSRCFKTQQGQAVQRDAQLADPAARRKCGKMQDQGERREGGETPSEE